MVFGHMMGRQKRYKEQPTVQPGDLSAGGFGASITSSTSTAPQIVAISAPSDKAVYIYEGDQYTTVTAKLTAPAADTLIDGRYITASTSFGSCIYMSNDGLTLAVGDYKALQGYSSATKVASGVVFIYKRTGGVWAFSTAITPTTFHAGMEFGRSVAVSFDGGRLFVGSPGYDAGGAANSRIGAVFFYKWTTVWTLAQTFTIDFTGSGLTKATGQQFGYSLDVGATNSSYLLIGAPGYGNNKGLVVSFLYLSTTTLYKWKENLSYPTVVTNPVVEGSFFGSNIRFSRTDSLYALISACSSPLDQTPVNSKGAVYWYQRNCASTNDSISSCNKHLYQGELVPNETINTGDYYGAAIDTYYSGTASSKYFLIGSPGKNLGKGKAYMFNALSNKNIFSGTVASANFGRAVKFIKPNRTEFLIGAHKEGLGKTHYFKLKA